jgi:chromosome segregation ATPase
MSPLTTTSKRTDKRNSPLVAHTPSPKHPMQVPPPRSLSTSTKTALSSIQTPSDLASHLRSKRAEIAPMLSHTVGLDDQESSLADMSQLHQTLDEALRQADQQYQKRSRLFEDIESLTQQTADAQRDLMAVQDQLEVKAREEERLRLQVLDLQTVVDQLRTELEIKVHSILSSFMSPFIHTWNRVCV